MGKTIRDDKGQYAGSIGDGKKNVPAPQHNTQANPDVPDSLKETWGRRRSSIQERLEAIGWEPTRLNGTSTEDSIVRWGPQANQYPASTVVKLVCVPEDETDPRRYEELLTEAEADTTTAIAYHAYQEAIAGTHTSSSSRPVHTPRTTRNEAGLTIVPTGAHAGDELSTLRNKLSGFHFAKEQLSEGEHEILLLAEGLLAILDEEDPRGYRR